MAKVLRPNFEKRGGLIDVIVQHADTKDLLMKGFSNEEAWLKSLKTGKVTLYSTSRERLWTKGEESGNFMKIITALIDCDGDAIVYLVEPHGDKLACHTLARSCFYRNIITPWEAMAPKAGEKEALPRIEVDLHESLI